MNRIYHHYSLWEDCNNGILKNGFSEKETEKMTQQAKKLLSNPKKFYYTAFRVIQEWEFASEQQLSNKGRNRRAWLGQASCCYKYNIPEYITKYGWRMMSKEQQDSANLVAEKIIRLWETQNAKKIF